jgi:hypothetical protein
VFRVKSEFACDKWIEIINSATIFSKFWSLLMQKSSKVSEYFWQLNQGKLEIKWDEQPEQDFKEEVKKQVSEESKKAEANSKNSMQSEKAKKKERRKNPYTKRIYCIT